MTDTIHVFEKAGLGKAPFRFIGFEEKTYQACPGAPIQPGGTCDYCGTPIRGIFHIQSADGRRFHVGGDCVEKTGDAGLTKAVRKQVNDAKHDREAARITRAIEWLAAHPTALTDTAHPTIRGKTGRDYAEWMFRFAGQTGKLKVAMMIEKLMK